MERPAFKDQLDPLTFQLNSRELSSSTPPEVETSDVSDFSVLIGFVRLFGLWGVDGQQPDHVLIAVA